MQFLGERGGDGEHYGNGWHSGFDYQSTMRSSGVITAYPVAGLFRRVRAYRNQFPHCRPSAGPDIELTWAATSSASPPIHITDVMDNASQPSRRRVYVPSAKNVSL